VSDPACDEYRQSHNRCAVCHWPDGRWGRWLELHHIVGGRGRKHVPYNMVMLCSRCHRALHDKIADHPEIPKGAILTAKKGEDGKVKPEQLAALQGKKALSYEPESIPEFYMNERTKRGGQPWP